MSLRASGCLYAAALVLLLCALLAGPAWGLINPNFTPIHLSGEATVIGVYKLPTAAADRLDLELAEALKGEPPKKLSLDIAAAPKEHAELARNVFKLAAGEPVMLFVGTFEGQEQGLLHAHGTWLTLSGQAAAWKLAGKNQSMDTTWNGGTDMLLRCTKYILAAKNRAKVPVEAGTAWGDAAKIGSIKGKLTNLAAVDPGDGKLLLHAASAEGDKLCAHDGKAFKDVTAEKGLSAKSKASAWGDFDGDGVSELASFDGSSLSIWALGGKTVKAEAKLPADTTSLAIIGLPGQALPALLASGPTKAVLLKPADKMQFEAVELAGPKAPFDGGKGQQAVVADFDNDGLSDIVLPFEKDGLLYMAQKDGTFAAPVACGVATGKGGGKAVPADFDGDGQMDILVAAAEGCRIYQNAGAGKFVEALGLSGEVAYKSQPLASACGACDFNNDARADLFLLYENQAPLLYFNRGFRSFGQASRELELPLSEKVADADKGQQGGVFADFDNDGTQDFVLVLANGDIWHLPNKPGNDEPLFVKLRLSSKKLSGPANVVLYQGERSLTGVPLTAGEAGFVGIPEAGAYTLKGRLGDAAIEKKLVVEDKGVSVQLP